MNNIKESFKNVTKSITSLNIVMWIRLLFGMYFKISDSHFVCWLLRLYCVCTSLACIIGFYVGYHFHFLSPDFFVILTFIFNIIFSLVTAEAYFLKFCDTVSTADTIMNYKRVSLVSSYVKIILFSMVISRMGLGILHYLNKPMVIMKLICSIIMFTSLSFYYVTVIIIFSLLHTRMKMLRNFLEGNSIPVNIIGQNEFAKSIRNLRKGLFNYSYLLDNLQSVNKHVQYILISALAFNIPGIIFFTYSALKAYYLKMGPLYLTIQMWELFESLFFVTSPGIIVELIDNEVVRIKTTLIRQMAKSSDEALRYELETAIEYVSWRPFNYMICGTVPLNARLPLNMAALCLTYVIILVQFLHLH